MKLRIAADLARSIVSESAGIWFALAYGVSKSIARSGGSVVRSDSFLFSSAGVSIKRRAQAALRPGVEALLLAAVALGCAQAGWSVLTPSAADALSANSDTDATPTRLSAIDVVSPFEPNRVDGDHQSQAIAAFLSGVQLSGVRTAGDPALSGAVLTLNDGAQRAFAIGQEISAGASLAEVGADYVVIAYGGGRQRITMTSGPSYSFARAMMGLEPAPGAPQQVVSTPAAAEVLAQPVEAPAPQLAGGEAAWIAETVAQVANLEGGGQGWRVAEPLPLAASQAGIMPGDVILAVNGAGPESGAPALLAALQSGSVQMEVRRDASRVMITLGGQQ